MADIVETRGICDECKQPMTSDQDLAELNGRPIHRACVPSEEEINRRNNSYT